MNYTFKHTEKGALEPGFDHKCSTRASSILRQLMQDTEKGKKDHILEKKASKSIKHSSNMKEKK